MVLFFTSTGELQAFFRYHHTNITFDQVVDPPVVVYMGRDKVESMLPHFFGYRSCRELIPQCPTPDEDLIKYAWPQDVWFHIDKLSSAHVYLRMPEGMSWESIPEVLLTDCAQLVKANSIEGESHRFLFYFLLIMSRAGNKKDNITIIYTPGDNLKVF